MGGGRAEIRHFPTCGWLSAQSPVELLARCGSLRQADEFAEFRMKLLALHPSGLMYTRVFLTLEPLGLELIAGAARAAGHDVRIVDLQVETPRTLCPLVARWRPDAVAFGATYLANVPEIIDTAKAIKARHPGCFVFAG